MRKELLTHKHKDLIRELLEENGKLTTGMQSFQESFYQECRKTNKYRSDLDTLHAAIDMSENERKEWRRDAQELQGVLNEIKAELQGRAIHLLSKHCWCSPEGHPWTQKGTVE